MACALPAARLLNMELQSSHGRFRLLSLNGSNSRNRGPDEGSIMSTASAVCDLTMPTVYAALLIGQL